jgi:hypothetical protein
MTESWTPRAYNLWAGIPFAYSEHAISAISGTEEFNTGINAKRCIVCGLDDRLLLEALK